MLAEDLIKCSDYEGYALELLGIPTKIEFITDQKTGLGITILKGPSWGLKLLKELFKKYPNFISNKHFLKWSISLKSVDKYNQIYNLYALGGISIIYKYFDAIIFK